MKNYSEHIINVNTPVRDVLNHLTNLPNIESRTLFILDESEKLIGTITDGDIRRGLIKGLEISENISSFMNTNFRFISDTENNVEKIKQNAIVVTNELWAGPAATTPHPHLLVF